MRFLRKIVHCPFFALSFILLIAGIVASFFVPTSNCLCISEAYTTKPINQIAGILLISGFIVFQIHIVQLMRNKDRQKEISS